MLTLLVLTDFSPAADQALRYAAALAAPAQARLLLLHVRPSLLSARAFTSAAAELSESQATDLLRQRSEALDAALRPDYELVSGDVPAELSAAARRHHATLVLVGRPDLAEIPAELAHTTALDVLEQLPCPLLVVPQGPAAGPPRQALLAVDGQPLPSYAGMSQLAPLLNRAALQLVVVGATDEQAAAALAHAQAAGLTTGFGASQARGVAHDDPATGIVEAAAGADLLVLPARQRSFLGRLFHQSVTARVLSEAAVPVLIVPERSE
ncbi:universal stress protein [Hymenobacter sp. B81]|uniref:universal stress protein n=1 Tax=Hymenobacter sp. B81 TaxID=3344878 RepID=UPI0037DD6D16